MRESLWEQLTQEDKGLIRGFWRYPGAALAPLLRSFGLGVIMKPMPSDMSGYLEYDPRNGTLAHYNVVVNKQHPRQRQRFTAAHELGHYLLHRRDDWLSLSPTTYRGPGCAPLGTEDEIREENEADRFAADLLMPINAMEHAVLKERLSRSEIAKRFDVSEEAARRRIDDVWRRRL